MIQNWEFGSNLNAGDEMDEAIMKKIIMVMTMWKMQTRQGGWHEVELGEKRVERCGGGKKKKRKRSGGRKYLYLGVVNAS